MRSCPRIRSAALPAAALALAGCGPWSRADPSGVPVIALIEAEGLRSLGRSLDDDSALQVIIANEGQRPVRVRVALDGGADDAAPPIGLEVTAAPLRLDPGATGTVEIAVVPLADGRVEATLRVVAEEGGAPLTAPVEVEALADFDGDGEAHPRAGGADCDDADPAVSPAAAEVWYDGVDDDCDGNDDDADGDGAPRGLDCDDADPAVAPGNVELWYDGVDADCDGNDVDADGDGAAAAVAGGADCDDADPDRRPGAPDPAPEAAPDGVDQDCDGAFDEDAVPVGGIVVNELMLEPAGGGTAWVELRSLVGAPVQLDAWTLEADRSSALIGALTLPDGGLVVLCADADPLTNGGVSCDAALAPWPDWRAASDGLRLAVGARAIDLLRWGPTWPRAAGQSLQLDPDVALSGADEAENDAVERWCSGPAGGSPGLDNPACP